MKQLIPLLLASLLLCQCISPVVSGGIAPGASISKLYIVKNDKLHMEGMQPEVVKQVKELGITPELVDAPPPGNVHYLTYTANWNWDMAMFLSYFKADLHQGPTIIGTAEYNTRKASGLDLNKFGHTDDKIRPLLRQLLTGEKPAKKPVR